ncbi:MAG: carboxy-S-adenosyl-L-methionine synthase CmoA [Pseudomonadales bacterium]
MSKDDLFARPQMDVSGFEFDSAVADVFPDMIQRSVPGYASAVAMSGFLAQRFAKPGTRLYDLGCSLGATSLAMAKALGPEQNECEVIGVDNSEAMLEKAHNLIANNSAHSNISLICADINNVELSNASIVALNYTLQFIELDQRETLLRRLAGGMNSGGVLILSEKIAFDDDELTNLFSDLHHDFKRSKGYSDLEISQKRAALENVLIPETLEVHQQRLRSAGFARVELWFQCLNFASLVAFK